MTLILGQSDLPFTWSKVGRPTAPLISSAGRVTVNQSESVSLFLLRIGSYNRKTKVLCVKKTKQNKKQIQQRIDLYIF